MNFSAIAKQLTPDMVLVFRQSLETSKWPDGREMSKEQKSLVLEALLLWEQEHLPEQERTGYMPDACQSKTTASQSDTIVKG